MVQNIIGNDEFVNFSHDPVLVNEDPLSISPQKNDILITQA